MFKKNDRVKLSKTEKDCMQVPQDRGQIGFVKNINFRDYPLAPIQVQWDHWVNAYWYPLDQLEKVKEQS
jgi:hypothetical protein